VEDVTLCCQCLVIQWCLHMIYDVLLFTSLWVRKFYEDFIQTQTCCNLYSYIKEMALMVAFSSEFIEWLSYDNLCRVFQVVISCYRMWCVRRSLCINIEDRIWKAPPSCSRWLPWWNTKPDKRQYGYQIINYFCF
jgi:hypothetical protein